MMNFAKILLLTVGFAGANSALNDNRVLTSGQNTSISFSTASQAIVNLSDPAAIYSASKTFSKTGSGADYGIIGTGAGSIGQAGGVELVAAIPNKVIMPLWVCNNFVFATAAYTAGGNTRLGWNNNAVSAITANLPTNGGFTGAANNISCAQLNTSWSILTTGGANAVGGNLVVQAQTAFTDPGTAAGTSTMTVWYQILSVP